MINFLVNRFNLKGYILIKNNSSQIIVFDRYKIGKAIILFALKF